MKRTFSEKAILVIALLILGTFVVLVPVYAAPVHAGSISNGQGGALLNTPLNVFVSGNYAYVASSVSGALEIIDISNPAIPVHKGSLTGGTGGDYIYYPKSVFVSGNYAYITSNWYPSLVIVDVSDPANPVHAGSIINGAGGASLFNPESVFVSGNYAYVTNRNGYLEIIDVSNPAKPVHASSIPAGSGGVYVSGNYAYVASYGGNALEIVDVSNPTNPVHAGSITDGTGGAILKLPMDVFVSGNYAYVPSYGGYALEIVDVSNPTNPVHAGVIGDATGMGGAHLRWPYSVYVSGNYAYVASNSGYKPALEIVDVSNPAAPVHAYYIENGDGGAILPAPRDVQVSGNYAYVISDFFNGMEVINLGFDTAPPSVAVTFPAPDGNNGWFRIVPVTGSVTATDTSNVASISCTGATLSGLTGTGTPAATATLTVSGEGPHSIVCTASDGSGNDGAEPGSANTATIKIDSTPPEVASFSVSPTEIWPPNLKMVDVTYFGTASDTTSGVKRVGGEILDEYQALNPQVFTWDFTLIPRETISFSQPVKLEAWRNGDDRDGRVYTIRVTVTDEAGNSVTVDRTVVVPHDKGK